MRFVTSSVSKCKARLGTLCEFEKRPGLVFETPLVLLYTRVIFNFTFQNYFPLFSTKTNPIFYFEIFLERSCSPPNQRCVTIRNKGSTDATNIITSYHQHGRFSQRVWFVCRICEHAGTIFAPNNYSKFDKTGPSWIFCLIFKRL